MKYPSFLRPERLPYASITIVRADGTESELVARKTDTQPAAVTCAWCADFVPTPGASHGMCVPCSERFGEPEPVTQLSRIAGVLVALAAVVTVGCGASALAPSAPVVAVAPTPITYAIHLPNPQLIAALKLQYPDGVLGSPIDAQVRWDYTAYYSGSPNVYGGPTVPLLANLIYNGVGILTCPIAVAAKATFLGSEWGAMASATATYQWVGRFDYAAAGPALDATTSNPPTPTCTPGGTHTCPAK